MPLSTFSSIPLVSPLDHIDQSTVNLTKAMPIMLEDASHRGIVDIRGKAAAQTLQTLYDAVPVAPGDVTVTSDGALARLRSDQFVLLSNQRDPVMLNRLNEAVSAATTTITDMTHGRAIMALVGTRADAVLPKICGLNFHSDAFPNLHTAQTSLAKVSTLITRVDRGTVAAYLLTVERSLAAYVWGVISDALQEFRLG